MSNDSRLLTSWKLLAAASRDRRLGGAGDLAVFIAIADRINAEGIAWPSLNRIASDTGLDRSTVVRATRRLTVAGYLLRRSGDRTSSNQYRLGALAECTRASKCPSASSGANAPVVGAVPRPRVGARTRPEPASLNLPHEPARAAFAAPSFWEDGILLLKSQGHSEAKARAVLGKLRKHRPGDADSILARAIADEVVGAAAYLMGHAQHVGASSGRLQRDRRPHAELQLANAKALELFGGPQ